MIIQLNKVISGGQTGIDQIALKLAREYCINPNDDALLAFIVDNGIQVLNVAGNKQSILTPADEQMSRERLRKLFGSVNLSKS
ncbi:hypothetical protein FXV77_09490 [Sphingobacterium phlebotomi]|uniref:Uncharacterized protein n=1 Tax=Sphingobacterium phlebotomi TaxID=2605433 RepID=A0A5D4H7B1_9SPHI|nr:hypothetical protein [Sphingobacterium phlebotomi]TYR36143.1 hypothetical protein FXV77_09490 [Sphingobacterium phlebotomi]